MLKIYDPIYAVSIDGGPWERLEDQFDTNWFVTDEDLPETELLLDSVSFQEAYDYLHNKYISGARTCKTIFKGRPQLSLLYFNTIDRKYIKKCKGFSLCAENRLRENVTLDWILYDDGEYRKQSEVAKEIFDEIEKLVSTNKKTVACATYEETIFYIEDFIEDLAELKKKYTGEKEDEQIH